MTNPQTEVTLIVRECGERTAEACVSLLSGYFPGNAVHRISGRPFHATLRRSLELGLRERRPWTLCIDADVLALPRLVAFVENMSSLPQYVFGKQALVLDKLLRVNRPAGNHLYRTELIATALPHIPAENTLRPETAMIDAMSGIGFPFHQSFDIIGLHDFEQFPQDIYAKAFLHGHKHRYLADCFDPLWRTLAAEDEDYRIALEALDEAWKSMEVPIVGRDSTAAMADAALARLGIAERKALGSMSVNSVQNMLEADRALSGEAGALRARLQERINAELDVQAKVRHEEAAARGRQAGSFIEFLKNAVSRTVRGRR